MNRQDPIALAMDRAVTVLTRRPDMGPHDDATARVSWQGGTRMVSHHANGTTFETDMPGELGGTGDRVTPGWLFRAGIAACASTTICMIAASHGLVLEQLEVSVSSRSDTRGFLGMRDEGGQMFNPGPEAIHMDIRIAAAGADAAQLRALVDESLLRSPMQNAMLRHPPLHVVVNDVGGPTP